MLGFRPFSLPLFSRVRGIGFFTNTGTDKGKLLFINTPAGPLEQFLVEFGEPVSDPSSPPEGEPDMDKLQASAQRTGGIEFVVPSEEEAGP